MAKRYIGDAVIEIEYTGYVWGDDTYSGSISAGGHVWRFTKLNAPRAGFSFAYDSPLAYDKMAQSAAAFGSYYTSDNRGDDLPEWAPTPETADAISSATCFTLRDDGEFEVRRRKISEKK